VNAACANAFNKLLNKNPLPLAAAEGNEEILGDLIADINNISTFSRQSSLNLSGASAISPSSKQSNNINASGGVESKGLSRSPSLSSVLLTVEGRIKGRLEESLVEAARFGYTNMVKQLLVAKAMPDARANGTTALVLAATSAHEEVMALLFAATVDVNQRDDQERSALQRAVEGGHLQPALTLLKAGALAMGAIDNANTTNKKRNKDGSFNVKSELLCAVEQGRDDLVVPLLEAKASINNIFKLEEWNGKSFTILDAAITAGNADTVKLLLKHKADPNILRPPNQQVLKELMGDLQEWV